VGYDFTVLQGLRRVHHDLAFFHAPNYECGFAQVAPLKRITQRLVPGTPERYPLRVELHTFDVDNQSVTRFDSPDIDWPGQRICFPGSVVQIPRVKQPSRIRGCAITPGGRVLCVKDERLTKFDLQDRCVMKINRILQTRRASFDPFHCNLGLPFSAHTWSYLPHYRRKGSRLDASTNP